MQSDQLSSEILEEARKNSKTIPKEIWKELEELDKKITTYSSGEQAIELEEEILKYKLLI